MKALKKLSKELSFLEEITSLKLGLDELRPLSKEIEGRVIQKLRLDWNYNSNAIEGNAFTFGETIALLMEGITAKGKPLKDALDIKGHNEAIGFMMNMIHDNRDLNEADIRSLHKLVLGNDYKTDAITPDGNPTKKSIKVGQYKTQPNHVKTNTGEIHRYATPEETPAKMKELIEWYKDAVNSSDVNPIVLAALFHHKFVAIHPFDDGNGRMTRILTNFILLKFDYPISVIKQDNKLEYYGCLAQADRGELIPIIEFISDTVKHSLRIYFKAINGENIDESDDLDKEIALFRKEIGIKTEIKVRRKDISSSKICYDIFSVVKKKMDKFSDLFMEKSEFIDFVPTTKLTYNINIFASIDIFKNNAASSIEKSQSVRFVYKFKNDIYLKNSYVRKEVIILFKSKNYIVSYKDKRVIKYYDEEIMTNNVSGLIKHLIQDTMNEIKKIKG
jgi:Fic family protein